MARQYLLPIFLLAVLVAISYAEEVTKYRTRINRAWAGGMQGVVNIPITQNTTGGWHIKIDFDKNVYDIDASCWAEVAELRVYEDGAWDRSMVVLQNPRHAEDLVEGDRLRFYFLATTWKRRKGVLGDVEFYPTPYLPATPVLG